MSQIETVKLDPAMFASSGKGKAGDNLTSDLARTIADAKVNGDVMAITFTGDNAVSEARGLGRRISKALEIAKLSSDSIRVSAFETDSALAELKENGKVVRYIQRVK